MFFLVCLQRRSFGDRVEEGRLVDVILMFFVYFVCDGYNLVFFYYRFFIRILE